MSLPDGHAGAPSNENDTTRTRTAFDLDTYIGRYASGSETQIQRLVFIAHHCTNTSTDNTSNDSNSIKQSALTMLERLLKESGNTVRYQQVFGSSCEQQQWLMDTIKANEAALEVLEARLSAAQANLNKDAIRIAHLNLGDFFLAKGEITDALRHVVRARDYCTSRPQTLFICGKVIELAMNTCTCVYTNKQTKDMMCFVSFLLWSPCHAHRSFVVVIIVIVYFIIANYSQVRDYVTKAEHSIVTGDLEFPRKLKVAAGMALLGEGNYKEAAEKFAQVKHIPQVNNLSSLASPEDVALYSSLLNLAIMPRNKLAMYLEQHASMLELVPPIRDALRHYLRAEYKACLDILLCKYMPLLEYDMILAQHVPILLQNIRHRTYVDYLHPFSRVHLPHMATMFGETTQTIQQSLAYLIATGNVVHARIDCRTETLVRQVKQGGGGEPQQQQQQQQARRNKTLFRIQKLQEMVLNNTYAFIIRLAVLEHEQPSGRGSRAGGVGATYEFSSEDVLEHDYSSDDDDDDDSDNMIPMVINNIANPDDDMF